MFKRNFAHFIQPLQPEMFFVGGDLEHAVGGSVTNGLAGFNMFFAQFFYNNRAGSGLVAQNAGQARFGTDFFYQLRRKGGIVRLKISPFKCYGHAGHFPVAGGRVLTVADFLHKTVFGGQIYRGGGLVPRGYGLARGGLRGFQQPQRGQIGQFYPAARGGNMPQGVSAFIAELGGVFGPADAERIHH